MKSITKTGLLGSLLVTGCALATPAFAADDVAAENLIVVRDAETGQMRAPTAAEAEALQQKSSAKGELKSTRQSAVQNAPLKTQPKQHRSGAVGARVNDDMASFLVVQRRPDGSVAEACLPAAEAEQVVREGKPLPAAAPAPTTAEK